VIGEWMRFYPRFIYFVLLLPAFSVGLTPALLAQVRQTGPTAVAPNDSPGPPEPAYLASSSARQPTSALDPLTANISGTVTDVNGNVVPAATVVLEGADTSDRQTVVAGESGAFQFNGLTPGTPYRITVEAKGFARWMSPTLFLNPGQYLLQKIQLKLPGAVTSVTVYASPEQIATQQVIVEEHQRVFGIIPNFYVTYDSKPVPLTTKLKFRLAYKADTDVMTFFGVAFMATIYQAGDIPDYGQGWDAYGKRVAAGYADTTTDIFIGGAILPWLLHQDPRYFYQGTGTKKSRARHAIFSPFVCRGDNGKPQPNYSSLGGDLASGAISNFYYPQSNRGPGLVFQGFFVTTGVRMVNGLVQEFVLRNLTPSARKQK
jgi:hypothetical protein